MSHLRVLDGGLCNGNCDDLVTVPDEVFRERVFVAMREQAISLLELAQRCQVHPIRLRRLVAPDVGPLTAERRIPILRALGLPFRDMDNQPGAASDQQESI